MYLLGQELLKIQKLFTTEQSTDLIFMYVSTKYMYNQYNVSLVS